MTSHTNHPIHHYSTAMESCEQLTAFLSDKLFHAQQKELFIALSGGSTPKLLFSLWSSSYKNKIPWHTVHFFWVDERCVPPSHSESNYKMTNEALLSPLQIKATHIHRMRGEKEPAQEAARYASLIKDLVPSMGSIPQFDLILLGMGADGHTASIFPNQLHLMEDEALCAVGIHPESKQQRITMTGTLIKHAKNKIFLVTGKDKKEMLKKVAIKKDSVYPASHITNALWFTDIAL